MEGHGVPLGWREPRVEGLVRWWWGVGFVFPGTAAGEMASLHKLCVVYHPERAKVVLIAHKALVQREVGADRILDHQQRH